MLTNQSPESCYIFRCLWALTQVYRWDDACLTRGAGSFLNSPCVDPPILAACSGLLPVKSPWFHTLPLCSLRALDSGDVTQPTTQQREGWEGKGDGQWDQPAC